jgi:catechol 2,3-dioxygenase-like lactoylglutathione lyase family enzyme
MGSPRSGKPDTPSQEDLMSEKTTPATRGVDHVGLTVPDLESTRQFFVQTLGFSQVGEKPDYPAAFVSDGHVMITLWQAEDPETARAFDRRKSIGLHHIALGVENEVALKELSQRLARARDVVIEFGPELLGNGPTQHMMCAIPGGIRVEFIARASRS